MYIRDNSYYSYLRGGIQVSKNGKITVKDAKYYNNKGVDFDKSKKYEEALKYYDKAININPEYANAYYNKGLVYLYDQGKYEEAIKCFDKVIQLRPKDTEACFNKMYSLFHLKKYKEAIKWYGKVKKLDSNYVELKNFKEEMLDEFHTYDNTLSQIEDALNFYGQDDEILKLKAEIIERQKNDKKHVSAVKEDIEKAESLIKGYSKSYKKTIKIGNRMDAEGTPLSKGFNNYSLETVESKETGFYSSMYWNINSEENTLTKNLSMRTKIDTSNFDISTTHVKAFYSFIAKDENWDFKKENEKGKILINNEKDKLKRLDEKIKGFNESILFSSTLCYDLNGKFRDVSNVDLNEESLLHHKAENEKFISLNNRIQQLLKDEKLVYGYDRVYELTYEDEKIIDSVQDFYYRNMVGKDKSISGIKISYEKRMLSIDLLNSKMSPSKLKDLDFSKTEIARYVNYILNDNTIDYSSINPMIKKYLETKKDQIFSINNIEGRDITIDISPSGIISVHILIY